MSENQRLREFQISIEEFFKEEKAIFRRLGFDGYLSPPLRKKEIKKIENTLKNLRCDPLKEEKQADIVFLENLLVHDEETKEWLSFSDPFFD